jgi:hypothetical protein
VIEMLHHADAKFRDHILRGIAKRDPKLAHRLLEATRASLARADREYDNFTRPGDTGYAQAEDNYIESQEVLERTQRSVRTRTYGR